MAWVELAYRELTSRGRLPLVEGQGVRGGSRRSRLRAIETRAVTAVMVMVTKVTTVATEA